MPVHIVCHGHSNIEIHSGEHRIQVDPFYNNNPLADVKAETIKTNHIFLTHAHFDHTDDAASIAKRNEASVISNFEIAEYYGKKKLKCHAMNHGGGFNFPFGKAFYTIAFHTSSFADGTYGGQPGGWVLDVCGKVIYHAGDTALFGDMALIGKLFPIDVALLPIGDNFTMGPQHAILAAQMLKPKCVIPIHYNTFDAIRQDPKAFAAQLEKDAKIPGLALSAGDVFDVP